MQRTLKAGLSVVLALATAATAGAGLRGAAVGTDAIAQLKAERPGVQVSVDAATGAARFVRLPAGQANALKSGAAIADKEARALDFLMRHGEIFGLRNAGEELNLQGVLTDRQGQTHLTYGQWFEGVPVFGATLKAHFDAGGELRVLNGTVLSDIRANSRAARDAREAGDAALRFVGAEGTSVAGSRLVIFREGLAKGAPGDDHLAWEIEVGNGRDVREFVYVDAHSGKVVDRIAGVYDALNRRAYNAMGFTAPGPNYPASPFWVEGQVPFPTGTVEADNMIYASGETYDLFSKAFGRDSFDGAGATMDSIFNRGNGCPNASWNGTFISFCPGLTTDDVTGHEWTHAYTQYTHNLIYQWQPGALNESYSDIFGETVDKINGRGGDTPDVARGAGTCSTFGGTPPPVLTITGGPAAGNYFARASVNEPPKPFTVGPTAMAIAATAGPFQPTGACGAVSGVSGKIAIIDWTLVGTANECGSGTRSTNAFNAGATGIIYVAPAAGILNLGSIAAIASVEVTFADGATIKAGLPASATMSLGVGTDNSVRWLLGEDDTAPGLMGPLRDMWNPRCFGNPGKVSDTFEYVCSTSDGGGVHTNSGIPNHAYALLVDGGTYNGQTVTGIGLMKAAHIYYRAMRIYQGPATNFADHADAIAQSCTDLIGVNLPLLTTGAPSGVSISAADCAQVAKAALAVELRTPPTFCGFQPLLAQNPPALCAGGAKASQIFKDNFDHGDSSTDRWSVSRDGTTPDFTPRDWTVVGNLPDHRAGRAFFGPDPNIGTCLPGGDETAVLHLDSQQITIPASATVPMLTFDHWVATEPGWDGGNVKISVNGGPWQLITFGDFVYNPYNVLLFTAAQGNTNPIAGQQAFSGTDGGAVDGTWGRSIVNLAPYAQGKDKVRLRFDMGNDGCSGRFGWYVDDVQVYQCK